MTFTNSGARSTADNTYNTAELYFCSSELSLSSDILKTSGSSGIMYGKTRDACGPCEDTHINCKTDMRVRLGKVVPQIGEHTCQADFVILRIRLYQILICQGDIERC